MNSRRIGTRSVTAMSIASALAIGLAGCGQHASQGSAVDGSSSTADGPYRYADGVSTGDPKYVKCWVQVRYDGPADPAFGTIPFDQIRGPVEVTMLRDLGDRMNHADWTGRVTLVTTGPTARVTLFEDEGLSGRSATVEPSTNAAAVADLGLGVVGSMRIDFVEP